MYFIYDDHFAFGDDVSLYSFSRPLCRENTQKSRYYSTSARKFTDGTSDVDFDFDFGAIELYSWPSSFLLHGKVDIAPRNGKPVDSLQSKPYPLGRPPRGCFGTP